MGKTVVIQGFGNVGGWASKIFHEAGARVIAVSDRHGATHAPGGLDVAALRRHTRAAPPFGGSLRTFPGGKPLPLEQILELPCDVFVPAAVPSVVNATTAKTLGCKFLVEAANASTTPAGDQILRERGIVALPDIVSCWVLFLFCFFFLLFFFFLFFCFFFSFALSLSLSLFLFDSFQREDTGSQKRDRAERERADDGNVERSISARSGEKKGESKEHAAFFVVAVAGFSSKKLTTLSSPHHPITTTTTTTTTNSSPAAAASPSRSSSGSRTSRTSSGAPRRSSGASTRR